MSTIQDSLTRQQFGTMMNSLLQSRRIAYTFTVFPVQIIAVLNCPLFPFNGCLSKIAEKLFSTAVASVVRIRRLYKNEFVWIFTSFKNFVRFVNFYEF